MDTPTKRRGRPPADPSTRLVQKSLRLTATDWQTLEALGGAAWLRDFLARKRPEPTAHAPRRPASKRARRLAELFILDWDKP